MSVERTEIGRLRCRKIEVEDVGTSVTIRDAPHAKSNHYIEQSRPYFPNAKLPTYINPQCFNLLYVARGFCFASLFGAIKVSTSWSLVIQIFFLVGCLAFFAIYCQHERVNQKSLTLVLKQPIVESQKSNYAFYEVTVTDLDGIALQNYQAGVGFISVSQGMNKFQAFNKTAKKYMTRAQCHSRVMMLLFLLGAVYNGFFLVLYA